MWCLTIIGMCTLLCLVTLTLISLLPAATHAEKTAFRVTDLDWRDPHFFATVPVLGCADITNLNAFGVKGVNPALQDLLQLDDDEDGTLDLNYLIVFDPLNQAGSGGTLQFGGGSCTAPLGSTACVPVSLATYSYDNTPASCLTTVPGTTNGAYTPAIVQPASPCFVAALGNINLFALFSVALTDAYLAAEYSGDPATGLVDGMIRGFITETIANQTIIPEGTTGVDAIDGGPLSELLRGGVNCCSQPSPATGDKDLGPGGVTGWYAYFNFSATVVPYSEPPTAVPPATTLLVLHAAVPNPFNPNTTVGYSLARAATVQLSVHDVSGRYVATLASGQQEAGEHQVRWDGRNSTGEAVSSGVYFVRLVSGGDVRVQKIALLK